MINDKIIPELRRIYGDQFGRIWWFQDGAPAHRPLIVRERIHELFGDHIVALNHNIEWPARSPDLTQCDFFLWGYLKSKVYATPPENMNQLRDRITEEVNQLKDDPGLIRRVVKTMRSRAQLCLRRNGGHVGGNGP